MDPTAFGLAQALPKNVDANTLARRTALLNHLSSESEKSWTSYAVAAQVPSTVTTSPAWGTVNEGLFPASRTGSSSWAVAKMADGRFMLAGGFVDVPVGEVTIYNPTTKAWAGAGSMIYPRSNLTLTTLSNGHVLAIGGMESDGAGGYRWSQKVEKYNPTLNSWTIMAQLPVGRSHHAACRIGNSSDPRVLLVGGYGSGADSSPIIYNNNTNVWSTATGLPVQATACSMVQVGDNAHVLGGTITETFTHYRYNTASNNWTALAGLPLERSGAECVTLADGRILLHQGRVGGNPAHSTHVYDPTPNTWADMPYPTADEYGLYPVHEENLLMDDGRVVMFGGSQVATRTFDPGRSNVPLPQRKRLLAYLASR